MKTAVYSWRLSPERKAELEAIARRQNRSVAELLDEAVGTWLEQRAANVTPSEAEQAARREAMRAFGRIAGRDPNRATQAHSHVREKLRRARREQSG